MNSPLKSGRPFGTLRRFVKKCAKLAVFRDNNSSLLKILRKKVFLGKSLQNAEKSCVNSEATCFLSDPLLIPF